MEKLKGKVVAVTLEEEQCSMKRIQIPFLLSAPFFFCSYVECSLPTELITQPISIVPSWQEHRDIWLLPYTWQGSVVSAYHFWRLRTGFCQPVGKTISGSRRDRDLSPSNPLCQEQSSKGRHLSMWSLVWPVKKCSRKWKTLIMELVKWSARCTQKHF